MAQQAPDPRQSFTLWEIGHLVQKSSFTTVGRLHGTVRTDLTQTPHSKKTNYDLAVAIIMAPRKLGLTLTSSLPGLGRKLTKHVEGASYGFNALHASTTCA